jgi:hypothetical protein
MEWSLVATLALITMYDSIRRSRKDELYLHSYTGGRWSINHLPEIATGWRLVTWWATSVPLLVNLSSPIQDVAQSPSARANRMRRRLKRSGSRLVVLHYMGVAVTAGIVLGAPFAASRLGGQGLILWLVLLIYVSLVIGCLAYDTLIRTGVKPIDAWRLSAPLASPFSAPGAAEIVVRHATSGVPPVLILQELLPVEEFHSWLRPHAYDELARNNRGDDRSARTTLLSVLDVDTLRLSLDSLTYDESASSYCPRCSRSFISSATTCRDCDVQLVSPSLEPNPRVTIANPRTLVVAGSIPGRLQS